MGIFLKTLSIDLRMIQASGIGTYLQNLIPRLIEGLRPASFHLLGDPKVLETYLPTQKSSVKIIPFFAPIYSVAEQIEFLKIIPQKTDLFWSPHYNIPLFFRGKLLVTIHDLFHLAMPQFVKGFHKRLYARFMFEVLRRKADAIIFVSRFTEQEFFKFAGPPKGKTKVIYHGLNEDWFDLKKELNPHPKPFLLFIGNVKPHKNLTRLLEAFQKIAAEVLHDLVIVGKKEGFITADRAVEKLAKTLGDRVHFTGYVDEETLRQYVAHADLLVFPSLYEGFGFPPLEAMAAGCPVLASSAASIPEICGDAVFYANPEDSNEWASKIKQLLLDRDLARKLKEQAKNQAKKYSLNTQIHQTLDFIKEMIS